MKLMKKNQYFKIFDLVDFLISSEIEIKKLNFNFLEPIDYDEEKDFLRVGKTLKKNRFFM